MIRTRSRLLWIASACAALTLSGCGGSSSPSKATSTPAISSQATTPGVVPTRPVPPTAVITGGSVAAIVNGHQVPMSNFHLLYTFTQRRYAGQANVTPALLSNQVMNQVIAGEIIKEYANKHHLSVSAAQTDAAIKQIETRSGGPKVFQQQLSTVGLTISTYKQLLGPSLLGQKVAKQVAPVGKALATQPQATVRHILIGTRLPGGKTARSNAAALTRAKLVLAQLQHGGNFKTLVAKYTDDKASIKTGGQYTVQPGQMVPQFEHAAFTLQQHKPTIVQTQYGYHIMEVLSRRQVPVPPAQQQTQMQQRQGQAFNMWLQKQIAHAKVQRIASVAGATKK